MLHKAKKTDKNKYTLDMCVFVLACVSCPRVSCCRVGATRYVAWRLAQFMFAWQERNYIRVVDLSWNGLGDPGAKEIGVYLAKNSEVTTLDISSNNFSAEGAISIAKGLKENTGLVTLRVSHPLRPYSPP